MNKKKVLLVACIALPLLLIGLILGLTMCQGPETPDTQPTGTTALPTASATQPTTAPEVPPTTTVPHVHSYSEDVVLPSCTVGGYKLFACACGESYTDEEVPALGHSFTSYISNNDATCTSDGTKTAQCDRCGESKTVTDAGTALSHAYEKQVTEATCTAGGFVSYSCAVCGDSYTDGETPALGHSFASYISNNDATCTSDGTKTARCDRCQETKTITDAGTALGHSYEKKVTEATCTAGGRTVNTCAVCGDSYTAEEVPALGHSFTSYISNNDATCTADGTKTAKCDRCGDAKTLADAGSALGHAYGREVISATCTAGGHTAYRCTVCGDSYTDDEVPALGHSFTSYVSNNDATCTADGTKTAKCDRCDATKTLADAGSALGHAYGKQVTAATCTAGGYTDYTCTACGDHYRDDETPAAGHVWSDWVTVQEPTEETEGKRERSCKNCDAREAGTIAKLPASHKHSYTEQVTAPTCTAGGYSSFTCVCGDTYTAKETAALGHSFTSYVSNNDATCTADGTKTAKCDRCDATKTLADADSALGHAYGKQVTAANCTAGGYTTYTCATCGDSYTDDEVPALGHSFTVYTGNGDATCTADGTKTAKCDRCQETKTITDAGSALGHTYEKQIAEATCITGGYTFYTCSACGDSYTDDEVPALGHSFTSYVSNNDATCTADGTKTARCDRCQETNTITDAGSALSHTYEKQVAEATCITGGYTFYTCSACGDSYTDDEVPALGHSFTSYVSNNDATCTADGTKTAKCDRCQETKTITDAGSARGHAYQTQVTEATCTAEGYTTYTCAACGDSYMDDEVPALGHRFSSFKSNNDATCTADGTKTSKCDRCQETKTITDAGSARGHVYEKQITMATCTTDGYTTYTCAACGHTYRGDEEQALGHRFRMFVSNGDATCTADGTKTAKCDRCDETETVADTGSALGHSFGQWETTVEATSSSEGKRERKCERCGFTEEETVPKKNLSYEEYLAMTPEEQQAYFESFADYEAFFAWLNAAKAEYEENKGDIDVGGDGSIDIGDIIGGQG